MGTRRLLTLILTFGLFALPVLVRAEIRYTVTDLGTLIGNKGSSYATAINDTGQVVGTVATFTNSSYKVRAFLWDGTMHDIGGLGGNDTTPYAINNQGEVVGRSYAAEDPYVHAFLYDGTMHDLRVSDGHHAMAYDINDDGVALVTSGWNSAYLCDDGTLRDLGASFEGVAINENGWVVGRDGLFHDGVWHDLGTLYDWEICPTAINNRGQVAGYISEPGSGGIGGFADERAFLHDGTMLRDLGLMPEAATSRATSINDAGIVVGWGYTRRVNYGDSLGTHAFVYDGSNILDLNDLIDPACGWMLTQASGINNRGQIVGGGKNALGQWRAFLLTPVPEPSAAASLGTAVATLAGLYGVRRKRKLIN